MEYGIAGGELIVVDLQTNEVLGVKRGFKYRYLGRYGIEQKESITGIESGIPCASNSDAKDDGYRDLRGFLTRVLGPIGRKED
jgi:hypothetical protein